MKRKIRKFAGGGTYDKEDEGLFGGKIKYREDEEGRKYVPGRANPMDRNPQEQRYYSKDDVKSGLSGLGDKISNFFGGRKDSAAFQDLESVGGPGRRPRTIEEQIGRKAETAKPVIRQGASTIPLTNTDLKQSSGVEERPMTDIKKSGSRVDSPSASDDKDADKVVEELRKKTNSKNKPAKVSDNKAKPAKAADVATGNDKEADKVVEGLRKKTNSKNKPAKVSDDKDADKVVEALRKKANSKNKPAKVSDDKAKPAKTAAADVATDEDEATAEARMRAAGDEWRKKQAAKNKKPGDVTFLTKERSDAAKKSFYSGFKRKEADKPKKEEVDATRRRFAGTSYRANEAQYGMKEGGAVKSTTRSASSRADGCAIRGKTRA